MKLIWGKIRMWLIYGASAILCVPIKVREEYLQEHVFGMEVRKTNTQ